MNRIIKRWAPAALWLFLLPLYFSCARPQQEAPRPALYRNYDARVNELREAVGRGELTVSEAEELRKEAFLQYLEEIKKHQVAMEFRNY